MIKSVTRPSLRRPDWITCLRAPAIQELAAQNGPLQLSLFDDRDLAEISAPDLFGASG
jgi:hypothetical protein